MLHCTLYLYSCYIGNSVILTSQKGDVIHPWALKVSLHWSEFMNCFNFHSLNSHYVSTVVKNIATIAGYSQTSRTADKWNRHQSSETCKYVSDFWTVVAKKFFCSCVPLQWSIACCSTMKICKNINGLVHMCAFSFIWRFFTHAISSVLRLDSPAQEGNTSIPYTINLFSERDSCQ